MSWRNRTLPTAVFLAGLASFPLLGADDGRFALAVDEHNDLVVTGPNDVKVSEMPVATVGRAVTVGDVAFQVSYGRDATGLLTAVLTPSDSHSGVLHFKAGGRNIDSDKADITLTFSRDHKTAEVDPGYVGTVDVDSHRLRAHLLSDDAPVPSAAPALQVAVATPSTSANETAPEATESTPAVPTSTDETPAPAASVATTSASPQAPAPSAASFLPSAPPMLASQMNSILTPLNSDDSNKLNPTIAPARSRLADTAATPTLAVTPTVSKPMKLYWSEPVTGPDGTAPQVGLNEIKLVEVQGEVAVVLPSGETQTGAEGMLVPSGSTVRTLDNSSAALFMGGVDSARMMPQCELVVTQKLENSNRDIVLDLHRGAVFSRVSHRDGETENFQVHTPEGSADANHSEMMAFRGTLADLQGAKTTMRSGLVLDKTRLLAWNPDHIAPGLVRDLPESNLGILTSVGPVPSTYYYFAGNKVTLTAKQIQQEIFADNTGNAIASESEPDAVLQGVMLVLQPFNLKLAKLLKDINAGTESTGELNFYHNLVTVFFDQQVPSLIGDLEHHPKGFARELSKDSAILYQDLRNFNINSLTPGAGTAVGD